MAFLLRAAFRPSLRAVAGSAAAVGLAASQLQCEERKVVQRTFSREQHNYSMPLTQDVKHMLSRTASSTGAARKMSSNIKRELTQETALWKAFEKRFGGKKTVQLTFNDVQDLLKDIGLKNQYILRHMFQAMDEDGGGTVDFQELSNFCLKLASGTVAEKAKFLFNATDTDRSGTLDKQEVRGMVKNLILACHETLPSYSIVKTEQEVAFTQDLELNVIALYMSNKLVYEFFHAADTNKDDIVSLDEYLRWVQRGTKHAQEFCHFFDLFDHLLH